MSDNTYPTPPYLSGPATPTGVTPAVRATAEDPGRTMGIVGLVLAIVANWIGLVVSILAFRKSKRAGFTNTLAKAGIIVGAITTALAIGATIVVISVSGSLMNTCSSLGPGTHEVNGVTYTCS